MRESGKDIGEGVLE